MNVRETAKWVPTSEGRATQLRALANTAARVDMSKDAAALDRNADTALRQLYKNLPAWQRWGAKYLGWIFLKTVEQGAATTCYVATSPELVDVRGFYFSDCNVDEGSTPFMQDDAMAAKLWQVSTELTRDYLPAQQHS